MNFFFSTFSVVHSYSSAPFPLASPIYSTFEMYSENYNFLRFSIYLYFERSPFIVVLVKVSFWKNKKNAILAKQEDGWSDLKSFVNFQRFFLKNLTAKMKFSSKCRWYGPQCQQWHLVRNSKLQKPQLPNLLMFNSWSSGQSLKLILFAFSVVLQHDSPTELDQNKGFLLTYLGCSPAKTASFFLCCLCPRLRKFSLFLHHFFFSTNVFISPKLEQTHFLHAKRNPQGHDILIQIQVMQFS